MARLTITAKASEPSQVGRERGEQGIQGVSIAAPILPAPRRFTLPARSCTGLAPSSCTHTCGVDAHQVAAPPAVDGDARQREDGFLDVDRHLPARAEGRGAAHQVAAVAVGDFRRAGFDRLGADLARQVLGRHLAVAVHQHDQRPRLLVLHDQRLDHGERVEAEHLRAVRGAAVLHVLVGVLGEGDAMRLEQRRGRGLADVVLLRHGGRLRPRGRAASQRMRSISASSSGASCVPQASRFSSSCASEVTPMMVLATCHLV